jgi:hypothetical protein
MENEGLQTIDHFYKTQNDNKIKVYFHVARINKILHYMLNMTINTVGTLNLSTEFHYCFYIKSSFVLWYYIYHTQYLQTTHMFYQYNSRLSLSITSDVMNHIDNDFIPGLKTKTDF